MAANPQRLPHETFWHPGYARPTGGELRTRADAEAPRHKRLGSDPAAHGKSTPSRRAGVGGTPAGVPPTEGSLEPHAPELLGIPASVSRLPLP